MLKRLYTGAVMATLLSMSTTTGLVAVAILASPTPALAGTCATMQVNGGSIISYCDAGTIIDACGNEYDVVSAPDGTGTDITWTSNNMVWHVRNLVLTC